jgi:holliday junction DNA helicase RuvA
MIVSIEGSLASATPLRAVVVIGGLGYELHIPVTTAEKLPSVGERVKLHTHAVYREDAQTLFGFATLEERDFFRLVIDKVSGVGPKMALSMMSRLNLASLKAAILSGDVATLAKAPGVGKKTAERLVVELRDSLAGDGSAIAGSGLPLQRTISAPAGSPEAKIADAALALTALGYKPVDADKLARKAFLEAGPEVSTEALVKRALR